jgi:hypothetical protein
MEFTRNPNITAIPLTLSLYYSFLFGQSLNFVAGAGVGYYIGKFQSNIYERFDGDGTSILFEADSNSLGFHGGVDLEFNISRTLALVFGVSGRFASLKDLMGSFTVDWDDPEYDTWVDPDRIAWYVEEDYSSGEDDLLAGKWYANLAFYKDKPDYSFYRNVRKAKMSLSSIALQIGFLIRLSELFK